MATNKDLSAFETIDAAILTLEHPRGGDLIGVDGKNPVTIEVYGPGTAEYVRAKHKLDINTQARTVAAFQNKSSRNAAEEAFNDEAAFLAAVTKSVNNFPESDPGKIYSNRKLSYIADQVNRFLGKTENFMQI